MTAAQPATRCTMFYRPVTGAVVVGYGHILLWSMRDPKRSVIDSASPARWLGPFLAEAAIVAFIFWADIHHWRHVVIIGKTPYLLVLGWISLRLRKKTWRQVGMAAPTAWSRAIFMALVAGCTMEALEIFFTQPVLIHLFHQPPDLSALDELHDHPGALAFALGLTWTLAAFGEELVWRGYTLNRIAEVLGSIKGRFVIALTVSSVSPAETGDVLRIFAILSRTAFVP